MNPTLIDLVDEWLFEKFPRYRLTQNKYFKEFWGVRQPNGPIVVRINTENNVVTADGESLSLYDPDFFTKLEKILAAVV